MQLIITSKKQIHMTVIDYCSQAEFGLELHVDFGIQIVVFNSAVPKDLHNMTINPEMFLQCMTCNAKLRQESNRYGALVFNHLREFYKMKRNNQDQPLPVSS